MLEHVLGQLMNRLKHNEMTNRTHFWRHSICVRLLKYTFLIYVFHLCKQSCSMLGIIDCCGGKYLSIYKAYALEERLFLKRNCIYPKLGNNQLDDTSSGFAALIPLSNRISCRAQHDVVHIYDFLLQQLNYMYIYCFGIS